MVNRLIATRTGQGIRQGELAKKIGISSQYLRLIEKGAVDPRRNIMIKIARELNCTVQELFFSDEEKG